MELLLPTCSVHLLPSLQLLPPSPSPSPPHLPPTTFAKCQHKNLHIGSSSSSSSSCCSSSSSSSSCCSSSSSSSSSSCCSNQTRNPLDIPCNPQKQHQSCLDISSHRGEAMKQVAHILIAALPLTPAMVGCQTANAFDAVGSLVKPFEFESSELSQAPRRSDIDYPHFSAPALANPHSAASYTRACLGPGTRHLRWMLSLSNPPAINSAAAEPRPCDATASSEEMVVERASRIPTNKSIVEEAWQIVNDYFLDARHDQWSSGSWKMKKEEFLKRPIPSRMAAYGIIRSMLHDLNDPYSRFLSPREEHKNPACLTAYETFRQAKLLNLR